MKSNIHKLQLPINKSQMIRELALHFIHGSLPAFDPSWPNDVQVMFHALQEGNSKDFEDAGTPLRLGLALLTTRPGTYITGSTSLVKRPLYPLLKSLEILGARFVYHGTLYSLPLTVSKNCNPFTEAHVDGTESSQFISALLLLSSMQENKVRLTYEGKTSSQYVEQTVQTLLNAGVDIKFEDHGYEVSNQSKMHPSNESIEKDYSSLVFLLNLAFTRPNCTFEVDGLNKESLQADRVSIDIYEKLGIQFDWQGATLQFSAVGKAIQYLKVDIGQCIDLAPALITACAYLGVGLELSGYENLIHKESNRIISMNHNLKQLGLHMEEGHGKLVLNGALQPFEKLEVTSFDDHRIVMAMSIFAMDKVFECDNKDCVAKSFPEFWNEFKTIEQTKT